MSKTSSIIMDPLSDNNPITIQILGICSALAVTVKMETAMVMSVALTCVVTSSNLVLSLMRNVIPSKIRMIVEMAVIATLVALGVIDENLQNSLTSKLDNALGSADRENICAAVGQLRAFKNQIEAQRGKKVSEDAADLLIQYVDNLIAQLLDQLAPGEVC